NPRNKGVLDNGSMTVDMNNPTCGDRIRLTFDIEDVDQLINALKQTKEFFSYEF
ncbi:iron-sulfur cluster assembly scaffold protein, partial [Staphylococcus aureus]|uniref:iron-sulfur cluster assembly scaffold protein n=1 Tax=Staphylococcus aureus TaxID=1280 RepID=UPI0035CCD331